MIRILDLTCKDLLQNIRAKETFIFLLLMPIIFTLLFGFAFGGFGGVSSDPRLPVGFLDQDNGQYSLALIKLLESSDVIRLESAPGKSPADLEAQVVDDELAAALIIPSGYSHHLMTGDPLKLTVYADVASTGGSTAQGVILTAATRLGISMLSAKVVTQVLGEVKAPLEALREEALAAWVMPPIRVQVTKPGSSTGTNSENAFAQTSPAMMAQFAIAGLLSSAQILVNERRSRCLQRLLTTAITRFEILLGHFLAMFVLILVQILILITFGQLFLKLDYASQPLATLVVVIPLALFVAGLGLLIGALAKTEDQAVIFSLIPMFIFSAMGGAWMPLEFTGKTFQAIGHLSPVAWAMDGFKNIVARGMGLDSTLLPGAVLIGYAVIFFGLAVWRFRFDS